MRMYRQLLSACTDAVVTSNNNEQVCEHNNTRQSELIAEDETAQVFAVNQIIPTLSESSQGNVLSLLVILPNYLEYYAALMFAFLS